MKMRKGYKVYPLTSAQKLHFYCLKYCPRKQVLNVGSSLTIQADLDWGVLKDYIRETIARCNTMHLCFTHDKKGNVCQYVVEEEIKEIEHFDFTGWKKEDAEGKLREWTGVPSEWYDSPMYHIVTIRMPGGYQGLYICVDYMTMDIQSLIPLFRDVVELYVSKFRDEVDHPKEISSCIEQLEKDLAYETGSRACRENRQFFQELITSSEPIFTDIYDPGKLSDGRKVIRNPKLRAATNTSDSMGVNITSFHLRGDLSGRLLDLCEKYDISTICLLLMGLRIYLQKEDGQDDASTTTTISRRATLPEKRCGENRIRCLPFRTIVPGENIFMKDLLKIRDAQNQYFRHADYSPSGYFNYRHDCYELKGGQTHEPLGLTYQPLAMKYDSPGLDKLGNIKYRTARYSSGVVAHILYLTVNHRAEDDDLDFGFEYQAGVVTPEKLECICYYLCRIVFRGIGGPERMVGEIIETM